MVNGIAITMDYYHQMDKWMGLADISNCISIKMEVF